MLRGGKTRLLHQVEDSDKRLLKSSEVVWSSLERKVMGAAEDYLERSADQSGH